MHLRDDIVMVHVGGVFEEGHTVDVERRCSEVVFISPVVTRSLTRNEMKRLHGVVEVTQVNISIRVGGELMLGLGDEKFVVSIGKVFTLIRV